MTSTKAPDGKAIGQLDLKKAPPPVQRGRELPRPGETDGIEILSGLKSGDRLVLPEQSAQGARVSIGGAAQPVRP